MLSSAARTELNEIAALVINLQGGVVDAESLIEKPL
jgi:hypothetical protein